jgi:hypothetical protein
MAVAGNGVVVQIAISHGNHISLNELRRRMPALRQPEQSLQEELRALTAQLVEQAA